MVRASLAVRFIVFISLLILATSLSLSVFFHFRYISRADQQIRQQGISLARNLAHNAELGVLTRNKDLLQELAVGLLREPNVVAVSVVDTEGNTLLSDRQAEFFEKNLLALPEVSMKTMGAGQAQIAP